MTNKAVSGSHDSMMTTNYERDLPGSLLMADQVRNMVYRVMMEDCRRPERG